MERGIQINTKSNKKLKIFQIGEIKSKIIIKMINLNTLHFLNNKNRLTKYMKIDMMSKILMISNYMESSKMITQIQIYKIKN